mmetsp:Transcript_27862/g.69558  ORF Transcript_27862/g.69558 Transcript_27862/m.69558 type:complete len:207 (-) Transcript_27862:1410-2030(-)
MPSAGVSQSVDVVEVPLAALSRDDGPNTTELKPKFMTPDGKTPPNPPNIDVADAGDPPLALLSSSMSTMPLPPTPTLPRLSCCSWYCWCAVVVVLPMAVPISSPPKMPLRLTSPLMSRSVLPRRFIAPLPRTTTLLPLPTPAKHAKADCLFLSSMAVAVVMLVPLPLPVAVAVGGWSPCARRHEGVRICLCARGRGEGGLGSSFLW